MLDRSTICDLWELDFSSPICQSAIIMMHSLSMFHPGQVRLRAACLGVKIRAEDGLGNTLEAIHHFRQVRRLEKGANAARHKLDKYDDDINGIDGCTELMLREMPNGIPLWVGRWGEQEAFFIYNEIFEDKTYSRMGIHVHDGDTLWDVGEPQAYTYVV